MNYYLIIILIPLVTPNPIYQGYQELLQPTPKCCHRNNNQNLINQLLGSVFKEPKSTEPVLIETVNQLLNTNHGSIEDNLQQLLLSQIFGLNDPKLNNFNYRPKIKEPVCLKNNFNTQKIKRNRCPKPKQNHEGVKSENLINYAKKDTCDLELKEPIENGCCEPKVINNYFIVNPNDNSIQLEKPPHICRQFRNVRPIRRDNNDCFRENNFKNGFKMDSEENNSINDRSLKNNEFKRTNLQAITRIPGRYNGYDTRNFVPRYRDMPRFLDFIDRYYTSDVINRDRMNKRKYFTDTKPEVDGNNKEINNKTNKKTQPTIKIKYIPKKPPANETSSEINYVKPVDTSVNEMQNVEQKPEELQPVFIPDNCEVKFEQSQEKIVEFIPEVTPDNNLEGLGGTELPEVETISAQSRVSYALQENDEDITDRIEVGNGVGENITVVLATSVPENDIWKFVDNTNKS